MPRRRFTTIITSLIFISLLQILNLNYSIDDSTPLFTTCKSNNPITLKEKTKGDVLILDSLSYPYNTCMMGRSFNNISNDFQVCYPSIVIGGFPKCGTSYLFKMMSKHPKILATKRKELCIGGPKSESWQEFFSFLPSPSTVGHRYVMSGCLHLGANQEAATTLCAKDVKYIFMVRNMADMLWASYNYWCMPHRDDHCLPGGRTTSQSLRTPEDFHKIIVTKGKLGGGLSFDFQSGKCFQQLLEQVVSVYGKSNIHLVKSEDMQANTIKESRNQSFSKLSKFLDLSTITYKTWFDEVVDRPVAVNAGQQISSRGEFVESTAGKSKNTSTQRQGSVNMNGLYEVSGYRAMLTETRGLIGKMWMSECRWLKSHWGIHYDDSC